MSLTDAEELLKAIRSNNYYDPNNWENDFIESITEQVRISVPLTPSQSHKLQEIYRKAYGG